MSAVKYAISIDVIVILIPDTLLELTTTQKYEFNILLEDITIALFIWHTVHCTKYIHILLTVRQPKDCNNLDRPQHLLSTLILQIFFSEKNPNYVTYEKGIFF